MKIIILFLAICILSKASAGTGLKQKNFTNSIGMEFVYIPPGTFTMGDENHSKYIPHAVTISKDFYLGIYEVTQAQWKSIMGNNPSRFKGDSNPVDQVSWVDIQEFIKKLNDKENTNRYRLPTEAEWEYGCRAGTITKFFFGDDAKQIDDYAWYFENSKGVTHPVGQKKPNPWGLYDMLGNISELCQDWFSIDYYKNSPSTDPQGPLKGTVKVFRGGDWGSEVDSLAASNRPAMNIYSRSTSMGFRLLMMDSFKDLPEYTQNNPSGSTLPESQDKKQDSQEESYIDESEDKIYVFDTMPTLGDPLPETMLKDKEYVFFHQTSSGSIKRGYDVSFNNIRYIVARDSDGSIIKSIETYDEKFETPEGFSRQSTFKSILEAMDCKLYVKPEWCYFIPLPSGWYAAFLYGKTRTFDIPDDDTKAVYFFREKDPWGLVVDYQERKKKKGAE